jgi:hypothetical protein
MDRNKHSPAFLRVFLFKVELGRQQDHRVPNRVLLHLQLHPHRGAHPLHLPVLLCLHLLDPVASNRARYLPVAALRWIFVKCSCNYPHL